MERTMNVVFVTSKMVKEFFKKHFTLSQFSLAYEDKTVFITSQWQSDRSAPSLLFLIYRLVQALIFFLVWACILTSSISYKYLTYWSYTLDTIQTIMAFVMLSIVYYGFKKNKTEIKDSALKCSSLYWLLSNTSTILAFMVSFVFWIFLYHGEKQQEISNILAHAVQTVQLFIDIMVSRRPVRILHFVYGVGFGVCYTIFNASFYYIDRHYGGDGIVYPILDWATPGKCFLTIGGVFVLLFGLNLLVYGLYRFREYIYSKVMGKKESSGREYDLASGPV